MYFGYSKLKYTTTQSFSKQHETIYRSILEILPKDDLISIKYNAINDLIMQNHEILIYLPSTQLNFLDFYLIIDDFVHFNEIEIKSGGYVSKNYKKMLSNLNFKFVKEFDSNHDTTSNDPFFRHASKILIFKKLN